MRTRLAIVAVFAGLGIAVSTCFPLFAWDAVEAHPAAIGSASPMQDECLSCWTREVRLRYAGRDGITRCIRVEESLRSPDAPASAQSLLVDPSDSARAWRRTDLVGLLMLGGVLMLFGGAALLETTPCGKRAVVVA